MTDNERADLEALANYMDNNASTYWHESQHASVEDMRYIAFGKFLAYCNARDWLRQRLYLISKGLRFSNIDVMP